MKEIRLILILRSLDVKEFKKLEEMVHSPYFNKNKKCQRLFEILKPFYPHFDDKSLTREWLFFELFPEKEKMNSSINIFMSKLQDLAEKHLIYQELDERFLYKKNLLLNCHLKKGLHKHYKSEYKETMARFASVKKRDAMNFLEQFLIENNYRNFQKGRDQLSNPKRISKLLDSYYLTLKLNLACEKEVYGDITSSEEENEEELIEFYSEGNDDLFRVNKKVEQSHISILFRRLLNSIQKPESEEMFDDFLVLFLNTDPTEVDKNEYNEFFVHSINYCIDKIIAGKHEYMIKLFELYKMIVDFELIYENGYLNLIRLKNIISCAVQVGETEWAMRFLKDYKNKIHPDQYNNAFHFNSAMICFYSKEYDQAIKFLNKVETDIDKYYFLNRTTLLLRCYYEGKSRLAFGNKCKTFRANIKRNKKLTTKEKRRNDNFVRIAYFIHQYRDGFSKKTKPKLLEMINDGKQISHKQWLLEKLAELK